MDGGLQLEQTLGPDARLATLLAGIRARRWVLTNAGLPHARRVLRLLGVEEYFEGIIYCDYSEPNFPAKPDRLAYERAMRRGVRVAIFTEELFATGHDEANRAAVAAVASGDLKLVGIAMRAERNVVDKVLKGLALHG